MTLKQTLCNITPALVSLSSQLTTFTVLYCLGYLIEAELLSNFCLNFSICFLYLLDSAVTISDGSFAWEKNAEPFLKKYASVWSLS